MLLKPNFGFWLYKSKINSEGLSPISMRISLAARKLEIFTGVYVKPSNWNPKTQRISEKQKDSLTLNLKLDQFRHTYNNVITELLKSGKDFTVETIRNKMRGNDIEVNTIISLITYHNNRMEKLVGKEFAKATLCKYQTTKMLVQEFLNKFYRTSDFNLKQLSVKFLLDFEHWLKTERGNSHNSAAKYLKNVKKIVNMAVINEWLDRNPFLGHKVSIKLIIKDYLTEKELKSLELKKFSTERLNNVRNLFLFSCYTGLAYVDVLKLKPENIVEVEGRKWLITYRTKTNVPVRVPLLPKAISLLDKIKSGKTSKTLFDVPTNQKLNEYLKEIAAICSINKNLTFHVARRTMATINLTKGVSLSSVSKMLGHTNTKITESSYATTTNEKILNEVLEAFG